MKKIILVVAVMLAVAGTAQAGETEVFLVGQPIAQADHQVSHTLMGVELKHEFESKGSVTAYYLTENASNTNSAFKIDFEAPLGDIWRAGVGLERRLINADNIKDIEYTTATVKIGFKW